NTLKVRQTTTVILDILANAGGRRLGPNAKDGERPDGREGRKSEEAELVFPPRDARGNQIGSRAPRKIALLGRATSVEARARRDQKDAGRLIASRARSQRPGSGFFPKTPAKAVRRASRN